MPGFAAPGVLFAGNSAAPDRAFYRQVFNRLDKRTYTRYVEVGVGSFAATLVAANAGIPTAAMDTSDVTLYSSVVGTLLAGGDLAGLAVTLDGEPVELPDAAPVDVAAHLLYVQWLARMQAKPEAEYWQQLVTDMVAREAEHKAVLAASLRGLVERLPGVAYRPRCMWDHIAEVADDPHTIIVAAPPTYKAGFERFFDTGDRLAWAEPAYEVFDPETDMRRLVEVLEDKPALLMFLQEDRTGHAAHPRPVFAHPLGPGSCAYVISNRPDEIFALTGGPKVAVRGADYATAPLPILPPDHEVTADSAIRLLPIKGAECDYYRNLWMHRLSPPPGGHNVLVAIDGFAGGIIGYGLKSRPRHDESPWARHMLLRFACGAPHHELRLTRLATALALRRATAELVITGRGSVLLASSPGLVTVETSRHPEVKGLRGLMKRQSRDPHPDGHKLIYTGDWTDTDVPDVLTDFLTKEAKWRKARQRAT
jgi:hypothetical protein